MFTKTRTLPCSNAHYLPVLYCEKRPYHQNSIVFRSPSLIFTFAHFPMLPAVKKRGDFSMVINCVPTAKGRYEMLRGYREHLRDGGHLFLMLPLLCLTKSTRTTRESFVETLTQIGFEVVAQKESPKVAFFCLMTAAPLELDGPTQVRGYARKRNRGGNDFAVSLC